MQVGYKNEINAMVTEIKETDLKIKQIDMHMSHPVFISSIPNIIIIIIEITYTITYIIYNDHNNLHNNVHNKNINTIKT